VSFKFHHTITVDPKHHHIRIDNYQTSPYHNSEILQLHHTKVTSTQTSSHHNQQFITSVSHHQ